MSRRSSGRWPVVSFLEVDDHGELGRVPEQQDARLAVLHLIRLRQALALQQLSHGAFSRLVLAGDWHAPECERARVTRGLPRQQLGTRNVKTREQSPPVSSRRAV